jgi:hypothetical protein
MEANALTTPTSLNWWCVADGKVAEGECEVAMVEYDMLEIAMADVVVVGLPMLRRSHIKLWAQMRRHGDDGGASRLSRKGVMPRLMQLGLSRTWTKDGDATEANEMETRGLRPKSMKSSC